MKPPEYKAIFREPSALEDVMKICLFFAPGFLVIGYFARAIFIQLDWLKLISVSALFTLIFIFPMMVISWILVNILPWKLRISLLNQKRKTISNKSKIAKTRSRLMDFAASIKGNKLDPKVRQEIKNLKNDIDHTDKDISSTLLEIKKFEKDLAKKISGLKLGFYNVFLENMAYLYVLFVQVLLIVLLDYLFPTTQRMHFRDVIIYFFRLNYLIIPWLMVASFLFIFNRSLAKKPIDRFFVCLLGVVFLIVAIALPLTIKIK